MSDTTICWVPVAGLLGEATLADVLLCRRDTDIGGVELCDSLLRRYPGAAVVLLVPKETTGLFDCVGWPAAIHFVASLLHTWFSAGFRPAAGHAVRLWCPTHWESAGPCGALDLVITVRRGVRQGIEASPHAGRT